nr:glycosyl hydrolase family 18 protein [Bacteroidota bacterium]
SSTNAGPIAPMTGFKENKYFFDVTAMYDDLEKYIPKEKIIMGVPHYGWDWAVEDGKTIQSTTLLQTDPENYAAVISYARAKEFKDFKKNQCKFDDYAKEPWCWYKDKKTGVDHQVWFQNEKSIGIKYDFANTRDFRGIAIWTLGYDKDYPDLWELMKKKFIN